MTLCTTLPAVGALALLALVSGCTAIPSSASAEQAAAFPEVYAQTIDWGECGDDFGLTEEFGDALEAQGADLTVVRCALVEAPLDWNDPGNDETIMLAVTHIPATGGEKIGTLFSNPGGPGGSGLDLAFSTMTRPGFAPVAEQYDVFGFDPRGIGRSSAVDCDPYSSIFELQLAVCAEEHPLARSMGTSQVARDMDLLRSLQGEDSLDYLGYSYGTILGATYATLFPERVGRMILDSAPDNTWASPSGAFAQAVAIANQVVATLQECGTVYDVEACPLRSDEDVLNIIEELNETPLVTTSGEEVFGGTFYGYILAGLYGGDPRRAAMLNTVSDALAGEQAAIDQIGATMSTGGASVSMGGRIVQCHSFPRDPDLTGLLDTVDELGMPALLGGPELTDDNLRPFADISCGALAESGDDLEAFVGPTDTTILVIGITGDHATPFERGQNLAAQMSNTRFLTLDGHGHGAGFAGRSQCVDEASTAFLLTGALPAEGTVCLPN